MSHSVLSRRVGSRRLLDGGRLEESGARPLARGSAILTPIRARPIVSKRQLVVTGVCSVAERRIDRRRVQVPGRQKQQSGRVRVFSSMKGGEPGDDGAGP